MNSKVFWFVECKFDNKNFTPAHWKCEFDKRGKRVLTSGFSEADYYDQQFAVTLISDTERNKLWLDNMAKRHCASEYRIRKAVERRIYGK